MIIMIIIIIIIIIMMIIIIIIIVVIIILTVFCSFVICFLRMVHANSYMKNTFWATL